MKQSQTRGGFDPAAGAFVAQGQRPADLLPVDASALTPLQRALLVIDGTVTSFLEAWSLEPVEVVRLGQEETRLAQGEPWLQLEAGAGVIRRRVMLRGRRSLQFYAWADSLIATDRLTPRVRRGLEHEDGGLGKILIDSAAETRRECLWYGREAHGGAPPGILACWSGDFLTRTYRVYAGGMPTMLITEHFPL